jgi:hypothetical protein
LFYFKLNEGMNDFVYSVINWINLKYWKGNSIKLKGNSTRY